MKVVVTGAAGFIGSHVVGRLLDEDCEVTGIDDLSMGLMGNLVDSIDRPGFRFLDADVTDDRVWADLPKVDAVIHLAARKIPRYGGALETLRVNSEGTWNALEFASQGDAKVVLASTSEVYGRNPEIPFREDVSDSVLGPSTSPRWVYAVSKLYDEHLAFGFQDERHIPVTLLRFFGSYGPRQHLSWWGGAPPVFIDCVLRGKPVTIHGDGSQRRTFTYISDTARGVVACLFSDHANGEIFNIGSRRETSILELAHLIKELSDTRGELELEFIPYESFTGKPYPEVMRRIPDTDKLESKLGITCDVSLEEGLLETIKWQATQLG